MASRFVPPFADVGPGISPFDGAKLFFFESGTSTPKDTFTNEALTIANSNPVIADANGLFPDIWIPDTDRYKVQLKDKNDVQIWEADPVAAFTSAFSVSYGTVALMTADTGARLGNTAIVLDYATDHNSGVLYFEWVASGTGADDGGSFIDHDTLPLQAKQLFPSEVSFEMFGAKGDFIANDATAINNCIAFSRMCKGSKGKTYKINAKIDIPANTRVDLNGSTIKADPDFPTTESLVEIGAANVHFYNGTVDSNSSNLNGSFGAGNTGCPVLIKEGASKCSVYNINANNSPTNGILVFGNTIADITIMDCDVVTSAFVNFGVEIQNVGTNPTNIKFLNINADGGTLGGFAAAGCDDLFMDNIRVKNSNAAAGFFYIGDAKGGLRRAKVTNSFFSVSNNSVDTVVVDGEVRDGALLGQREVCEVEFVNVTAAGAGGGTSLRIKADARVTGSNFTGSSAALGLYPDTGSKVDMSRLRFSSITDRPYLLDARCNLDGVIAEFWGAANAAIDLTANATGSILRKLDLGAISGETGQSGFTATGTPTNLLVEVRSFTGTGTLYNISNAVKSEWSIYDINKNLTLRIEDSTATGAPDTVAGVAHLYIDTDGDFKIKFGDGTVKTIATDT
jgi:hypothetical protein